MYQKIRKILSVFVALVLTVTSVVADETNAPSSYDEAMRQDPRDGKAYYDRGISYLDKQEWDNAITDFGEAIRLNPKNARAYQGRGAAYFGKGDFDNSIEDFSRAIRLNPTNDTLYLNRGTLYRGKRECDKAIKDINQTLRLNRTNAAAFRERAAIYNSKHAWHKAIGDWDKALKLNPKNPLNTFSFDARGWAHFMTGQFGKAANDYQNALQINPTNHSAYNNLAWLRATCPESAMRNGKEAVKAAIQACELTNWERRDYIDTLAAAHAEEGDFEKALKYQDQAISMKGITEGERKDMQRRRSLYEQRRPYHEGQKQ